MTQILIREDPQAMTVALFAEGHAGYANIGHDIVCASISILTQTFAQVALGLRELGADVVYHEVGGEVRIRIDVSACKEAEALFEGASCSLQTIETGYRLIAKYHPDYIKITTNRL